MSRPSKFCSCTNFKAELTNLALDSAVFAMLEYFVDPSFHPPTAKRVFKLGLNRFNEVNLLVITYTCMTLLMI